MSVKWIFAYTMSSHCIHRHHTCWSRAARSRKLSLPRLDTCAPISFGTSANVGMCVGIFTRIMCRVAHRKRVASPLGRRSSERPNGLNKSGSNTPIHSEHVSSLRLSSHPEVGDLAHSQLGRAGGHRLLYGIGEDNEGRQLVMQGWSYGSIHRHSVSRY